MMTVRFASGLSVQYNTANYVSAGSPSEPFHRLETKENGVSIARVPLDAIVEIVPAFRVYNAVNDTQLQDLVKVIKSLQRKVTKLEKAVAAK